MTMLKNQYILRKCDEIEKLLQYAENWSRKDEKLGAHLAAYICVLFVGILEDCIEHLIAERAEKSGDLQIRDFIVNLVGEHFRNPDYGKIVKLLGDFSPEYKRKFTDIISGNGKEANALKDIITNKNSLAHEGTYKLNLTVKDMADYYHRALSIIEAVEKILSRTY